MGFETGRPRQSRFLASAPRWREAPVPPWPQVAFAGRSNVGKSSLINALLGRHRLARTSSTPGRTQAINLFAVDECFLLADLPGYGYAKAPLAVVRQWVANVRDYVERCRELRCVVLLLDVRRDPADQDLEFAALVRGAGVALVAVATKCDKLGRGKRTERLRAIERTLGLAPGELIETSAKSGAGRRELWARVAGLLASPGDAGATPGRGPGEPGGSG